MKKPFRSISISLVLVVIFLILSATIAFAAAPLGFHMVVDEFVYANGETFVASGPAVNDGVVCPTGITNNLVSNSFGPPQGTYTYLYIVKEFICTDGSGTFFIKMKVKLNNTTGYTTAKWQFTNGSGDYSRLRGHGTLVGTPIGPADIQDVYDGVAH
jgi:hypothetical protein